MRASIAALEEFKTAQEQRMVKVESVVEQVNATAVATRADLNTLETRIQASQAQTDGKLDAILAALSPSKKAGKRQASPAPEALAAGSDGTDR